MEHINLTHKNNFKEPMLWGVAMIILAAFFIVVMGAFAKAASPYHDPIEILFYRGIFVLTIITSWILYKKDYSLFKTKRPKDHILRSVFGNISIALTFWAFALIPIANATAISYIAPVLVILLSIPLLGEKVGYYRWTAIIIAFAGVSLIIFENGFDPSNILSFGAFIALTAAFFNSLVIISLRHLGKTEDPLTTIFYFMVIGLILTAPYMIFRGSLFNPDAVLPMLGVGIAAFAQQVLKTKAYQLCEASLLSPFIYTSIIWSILIGWFFWSDIPTSFVVLGSVLIICSNLFILWRERKISHE